jgi:hypothetical protein
VSARLVHELVFVKKEHRASAWRWTSVQQIALLQALAAFQDDDREYAFPSVSTLAEYLKLSERQVQRVLRELAMAGLVEITARQGGRRHGQNRNGQSSCYRVTFSSRRNDRCERMTPEADKGDAQDRKGDIQGVQRVTPVSPDLQSDLQRDLQRGNSREDARIPPPLTPEKSTPPPTRNGVAFSSGCGLDVPVFIHIEFLQRVMRGGHTHETAEQLLFEGYRQAIATLPQGEILGGDAKEFWKTWFSAKVATAKFTKPTKASSVRAQNAAWRREQLRASL